jgi:hypothetical protein
MAVDSKESRQELRKESKGNREWEERKSFAGPDGKWSRISKERVDFNFSLFKVCLLFPRSLFTIHAST